MTQQDILKTLSDIEERIRSCQSNENPSHEAVSELINLIIEMHGMNRYEYRTEIDRSIALLQLTLESLHPNERLHDFVEAFLFYSSGKYENYLKSISKYLAKYIEEEKTISYETAVLDFFDIFNIINRDDKSLQRDKFMQKFHVIIKKHCPDSAFERYVKYYLSGTSNQNIREKQLLNVLAADNQWAAAYEHLAHLYSQKEQWPNVADCLEKALAASDLHKTSDLYFDFAWVYGKLRDYQNEEAAYRKCLEINPAFPSANNNLGYCLLKQKRYDEAVPYFDKSIALETDKHFPYRNKFEALKKLGHHTQAADFIKSHPRFFNTKHYREEVKKITGEENMSDIFAELQKETETDNAGEMFVADAASGIELYPHQKDAIRKMNQVILNAADYAGLLVLPTGGGKTLTATYWLMESLLDKGRKIIWLAHRHELLNQAQRSFEKVCYTDITQNKPSYNWRIVSGQHCKPFDIKPTDDIIVASKASLKRGLDYFTKNWLKENGDRAFLIIDEAHHATASEYLDLISSIKKNTKQFKMLGLTATPFRTADNEQGMLNKIFPDDIVYKIDLRELINQGILSEPIFKAVPTDINMVQLFETSNSEEALERIARDAFFDIDSIGNKTAAAIANHSKRNSAIVNEYVKNREIYKQTLVFALNVEMAIVLSGLFNAAGIRSDFVVSNLRDMATKITIAAEENNAKIQKFRNGELEVLVNVNILTEGTDMPKVQSVFLTRPTKSTILMTQMIGRSLRGEKAGGTKDAYIVSFIDDWQDKIAWVNPEQLFIDENVDFTKKDHEAQEKAMRLVSIAKMEEFARIANDTVDARLAEIDFIDRIPEGIYKFSYLIESGEDDDLDKSCTILVYDCMREAYHDLFAWLPSADLADVETAAEHADAILFGALDMLLGYSQQDVIDIIYYYKQTQEVPQMIYLSERKDYDVVVLARYIVDNGLSPSEWNEYIVSEWNRSDKHWSAFFGVDNQKAFRKLIGDAIDRIVNPDDYAKPMIKPMTAREKVQIQNLPLGEIRHKFPELEEKIRNAVFAKYTDANGFYYSAQSHFQSKSRLDFQIDHIIPMAHGGMTTLDNLQLLTRAENMRKTDKNMPPPLLKTE